MEQVVSGDELMQRMFLLRAYMGMREADWQPRIFASGDKREETDGQAENKWG